MLENNNYSLKKKKSALIWPGLPELVAVFLEAGEREKETGAQGTGQEKQGAGAVERVTNPGSL